ncbi:MAG: spore germination protein, partial [Oscillospiraceae bacterium]|nr:spore germination protein [Oscillospiraceae bacterium]
IDALLDSNYIAEYIKDAPYSPFKTVGISEKPDVIAGKLLEGRIAIIVDGSPVVLTVPFLIIENFQTADDYYLNFYFASIARILRILGFFLSISVPAVYVSLVTYHREMLPTPLALSIAQARQGVPLPTFVECFVMLLVFEIIRETGIRMPSNVGQALSVVGALVIGQAAVQAKFISAPMVIIVALTAITGLINQQIQGISILSRFALLCVSGIMGLYGYMFGIIILIIHLLGVRSFGVDYTSQMLAYNSQGMKDIYVRSFWKKMKTRPYFETKDNVRNGEPDKT